MLKNLRTFVGLLLVVSIAVMAGSKKELPLKGTIAPDQAQGVVSSKSGLNLNPTMQKVAVGTATKIGSTFYDYSFNSGGPRYAVFYNGTTYMLFVGMPTATAKKEVNYVAYNGTTFSTAQAVIPSATQATYFSGIDVFRGGDASGYACVAAGWNGSGKSYFGLESAPGAGNFAVAPFSNDRDAACLVLDSTGVVIAKDTKGRTDYKIQISTDFGASWKMADSTVVAHGHIPGGQATSTLDVRVFKFPDGSIGIGATIGSTFADGNLLPVGDVPVAVKDSANLIGYFKSTDKGKTWNWNTVSYGGRADYEADMYNLYGNFDQHCWLADKNGNVHMVANAYPYYYKIRTTDTISRNTMGVGYWDKTNGFKKMTSFDATDTNITKVIAKHGGNAYGTCYPSIAISPDAQTIVCVWSQPRWNGAVLDTNAQGTVKNNIWYNFSNNGGATWAGAANLTNTTDGSEYFPILAEDLQKVTGGYKARLVYIKDYYGIIGDYTAPSGGGAAADVYYHEFVLPGTGVSKIQTETPATYTLEQNYPNPFNPSTEIRYSVKQAGFVSLKVYNTIGQEVATVVNNVQQAGSYVASFDASQLSSGVYLYRLQAGNFSSVKKMVVQK